jgi:hypothetical protein
MSVARRGEGRKEEGGKEEGGKEERSEDGAKGVQQEKRNNVGKQFFFSQVPA